MYFAQAYSESGGGRKPKGAESHEAGGGTLDFNHAETGGAGDGRVDAKNAQFASRIGTNRSRRHVSGDKCTRGLEGAEDVFSRVVRGLKNLCRTYGARESFPGFPALTGWANLWRAYGAEDKQGPKPPAVKVKM